MPDGAPYDRIIATCAVAAIPPAWIAQLAADGVLVADVRGEIAGSLIVLRHTDDATVQGRFLGRSGHFMWLRAQAGNPLRGGGTYPQSRSRDGARERTTDLAPSRLDEPGLRFVLQFLAPDLQAMYRSQDAGTDVLHLRAGGNRWAEVGVAGHAGRYPVVEVGDRSIWAVAEQAARIWDRLGRPAGSRFGLTASLDGRQRIWLDDPDNPIDPAGG